MKTNKAIILILVLVVAGAISFVIYHKASTSYAQVLYNRLAQGDINEADCQKAADKYSGNPPLGEIFEDKFYSFQKKRCLGISTINNYDATGKFIGHYDKIFDLITDNILVSCSFLWENYYTHCEDSKDSWTTTGKNSKGPPPYAIYSDTWLKLISLEGKQ